ncbi:MAG TPA: hypothetical protein PK243_10545 [Flexilinea sp.]|nr:hypothetical protein [Flexilinea sp.]
MGISNPTYRDRVRFTLYHDDYGTLRIDDPVGWDEDEKEYARNTKYHGIFTKFSNSLKFVLSGAEFINNVRDIYGVNAEIVLTKDERHPQTDIWTRRYEGILDLSEWEKEDGEVSVKFNSSGLEKELKSRESEAVEIERETTMDGDTLDPLSTKTVYLEGRQIFLQSAFDVGPTNNEIGVSVESNAGNTRNQTGGIPLRLVSNSHQEILQSVYPQTTGSENNGDLGMMFLFDCDRDRTFNFQLNGTLNVNFSQYENVQWCRYKVCLTVYKDGFDFNLKNRYVMHELRSENPPETNDISQLVLPSDVDFPVNPFTINGVNFSYSNENFQVLEGESVALEVYLKADMYRDNNAGVRAKAKDIVVDFTIEEDSLTEPSTSKAVMVHELGERLVKIMTGREDCFYSEILGRSDIGYPQDGEASLLGLAHGMWIRQFDKYPINDENKYKPFTTKFKDYTDSLEAIWNIGLGIERVGFRERVRMEDMSYFYNNNVLVKLGKQTGNQFEYIQVKKVKRSCAKEYLFSAIDTGYSKGGEYEEAMGLDEYNGKANFNTVITRVKSILTQISNYRADSYGLEFARRKPKSAYKTEDTTYDKDVFWMDLKRFGSIFKMRKWQDDFAQQPTGVFSPDTATNLRLSPVNMTIRRGWFVAASLVSYPLDYIRYGSSTANSNLKTRLIGGDEYSENGDDEQRIIQNQELKKARFVPEWVEFEFEVDFDISEQLEGTTTILGRKIPNKYGLIEFKNENGELERGFLFNLKPNKQGKWKLLKANR